ncbi:MAG: hypothetical protein JWL96_832, partial [Sphingomonas bacterium]|nr:hypothetical protein [Sphingomonas bacterium]
NGDQAKRSCSACGHVHPPIDLDGFRWQAVVDELRAAAVEEEEAW